MGKAKSPLVWEEGTPRSALYGDIYFSLEDGLSESRAVFLEGCGLPEAWAGRERFTVAELGFGSGLNICALLHLWRRTRPPGARLTVFTVELHPISCDDAARALCAFPEIGEAAGLLLERWPPQQPGVHRIEIDALGAAVEVAVMEAADALAAWRGRADAWFLDGFSPALNPAMWREEVLDLVAARSAPGARAATFTVAGAVRRGLADRGFAVEKKPGYGRKRERLEARFTRDDDAPTVILGSGIAGAALARAFAAHGVAAAVYEDPQAPPASGNPAALVTPALDAGGGARAALYAQAFARAVALYSGVEDAVIARGAYQLEAEARDAARFDKVAAQALFPEGGLLRLAPEEVQAALGEPTAPGGLLIRDGLVVDPAVIRRTWAPAVTPGRAIALEADDEGPSIVFADGSVLRASRVVIASGCAAAELLPALSLIPVRGQATVTEGGWTRPVAFGAYAIPTRTGVLFGASHDRGDADLTPRPEQDAENLRKLASRLPRLAEEVMGLPAGSRVGVRATTRDRMPLAGELDPGVYILSGLGSRGFTTAPLLAEHVAALALGRASPVPARLAATVSPSRFVQP